MQHNIQKYAHSFQIVGTSATSSLRAKNSIWAGSKIMPFNAHCAHGNTKKRNKKVFSMISQGLVIQLKSFKIDIAINI